MTRKVMYAGAGLALVACLVFWVWGRPAYRHFKENRAVTRARHYLSVGDIRNATLCARQALALNPSNLEACRVMITAAEMVGAAEAVEWGRKIVEISPTLDNKLTLAATAMQFEAPPYPLASQTLKEVGKAADSLPRYHVLSAELALRLRRSDLAEAQFEAASRLEPTNEMHRLNLAMLRVSSTNLDTAAEGRAALESFRANTNLAPVALRCLIADARLHQDAPAAEEFSRQLLADPRCALQDRLQDLDLLRELKRPEFESSLETLQKSASTNASALYAVSSWMVGHGMAGQAVGWLTNCPAEIQAQPTACLARTDCFIAANDWAGLEKFLEDKNWAELEFMRLGFLSRAAMERHDNLTADQRWRLAVQQANDDRGRLSGLLGMAQAWHRDESAEDLLWRIIQKFPREQSAVFELEKVYMAGGNTRGLHKLYSALVANNPTDFAARNNLTTTELLLKLNVPKAYDTARELYLAHGNDPIIASTYAYSLYLQGRQSDALALLEKLPREHLSNPSVALYYGLLLRAEGQADKADSYFALARRGTLLPEEKDLIAQASPK